MKLKMVFVIDENGWPVRYGESDEQNMTAAQRVTYRSLRSRYKAIQAELVAQAREQGAALAEEMLSDPKIRRLTRKVV